MEREEYKGKKKLANSFLPLGDALRDFLLSDGHSLLLLGEKHLLLPRRSSAKHKHTVAVKNIFFFKKKSPSLLCRHCAPCVLAYTATASEMHILRVRSEGEMEEKKVA